MNQIKELRRELETNHQRTLRLLEQLEAEASRPPPAAHPPSQGLMRLVDFCASRDWPALRTMRRYIGEAPPPGFRESGIVHRVGHSILVDPSAFDRWVYSQGSTPPAPESARRGPGRPRRIV